MKKEKMGQPIKSLDNSGLFFIEVTGRFFNGILCIPRM
jgi:hypothetical protein